MAIFNIDNVNDMETKEQKPLTAFEIAEYITQEHTPYSAMTKEQGVIHIGQMIQRLVNEEVAKTEKITREKYTQPVVVVEDIAPHE